MAESETEASESAEKSPAPSLGTRVRRFFVTAGVAGVVALVAAGVVAFRDMQADRELEASLADAAEACDQRTAGITAERDAAVADAHRMHALLDVMAARKELGRGNFFDARARKSAAADHLAEGGQPELSQQVAGVEIPVTEDPDAVERIQERLAKVERRIDKLVADSLPDGDE